jgi:hypothetical protein
MGLARSLATVSGPFRPSSIDVFANGVADSSFRICVSSLTISFLIDDLAECNVVDIEEGIL